MDEHSESHLLPPAHGIGIGGGRLGGRAALGRIQAKRLHGERAGEDDQQSGSCHGKVLLEERNRHGPRQRSPWIGKLQPHRSIGGMGNSSLGTCSDCMIFCIRATTSGCSADTSCDSPTSSFTLYSSILSGSGLLRRSMPWRTAFQSPSRTACWPP